MRVVPKFTLVPLLLWALASTNACSGDATGGGSSSVGGTAEGGAESTGGVLGIGGTHATGGGGTTGGTSSNGASKAGGGTSSTGGTKASGGSIATGGTSTGGGTKASGGTISTGGSVSTGGTTATTQCPALPPNDAAPCGSTSLTCLYEDCPNTGRKLAACANGAWSVTVGTSCAVNCTSYGGYIANPAYCTSGQVCVISGGGAILASCHQSNCGQGPITAACAGAIACSLTASLTDGATFNCPVSCPPGSGGCS